MHCRILKISQSLPPLGVCRVEGWEVWDGLCRGCPSALLNCPLTLEALGIALPQPLEFMATIAAAARRDLKAIKSFTVSLSPWDKPEEPFSRPGSNLRAAGGGAGIAQVGKWHRFYGPDFSKKTTFSYPQFEPAGDTSAPGAQWYSFICSFICSLIRSFTRPAGNPVWGTPLRWSDAPRADHFISPVKQEQFL